MYPLFHNEVNNFCTEKPCHCDDHKNSLFLRKVKNKIHNTCQPNGVPPFLIIQTIVHQKLFH